MRLWCFKFSATKNCICINFLCSWIWEGLIKGIMYKSWIVSEVTYLWVLWIPWWLSGWRECECSGPVAVYPTAWGSFQVTCWGVLPAAGPWRRPSPGQLPLQVYHWCCTHSGTAGTHPVYVPSCLSESIQCTYLLVCLNASSVCTFLPVWMHLVYLPSCLSKCIQCTYLLDCLNASSVCIFLSVWTHPMYVPSCLSVAHLLLSCDRSCKRRI